MVPKYCLTSSCAIILKALFNKVSTVNFLSCMGIHAISVFHKGGRPLERGHDQDRLRKQIMSFRHSVRGQV